MQSSPSHSILDITALAAIREIVGDDEPMLFVQIIDCYLQESPALLAVMRTALVQENTEEFTRAAHSLKSSSQYLGAVELVALCRQLEQIGQLNRIEDRAEEIAVTMAQLEAQYLQVEVALQQERDAAELL
ncbi:Hpt domain-containing protein [Leptolyngbya sp. GB1-A1]|uniref:Hpt domain-containing protein n=2 Tax=Leptolyngbya TaxID=47251 RepID=UPI0019936071|nr:Hpt domain-containing protein [Cyanobacteria bacterium FACHB-502]